MSALNSIIKHYESIPRKKIHVKEWKFDIFFTKLTLKERELIYKDDENTMANALIYKAQNEDGTLMFNRADRCDLTTKADSKVIAKVALEILEIDSEEEAKND
ncbi:MAG: hypothetical protein COB02_13780 [Candidatus Cloacimonadota bacterium]|nr:MAG: hypothetical protein COB02_13780 [Candidatus Cloacimonadota bacterium]